MTFRSFGRWLPRWAAALFIVFGVTGAATAADDTTRTPTSGSMIPGAPCPTCTSPPAACTSGTCSKSLHGKRCTPDQPYLCPGACFGYFQTQWNRWEDVCPLPYQGVGLNDAPRPPIPPATNPLPLPKAVPDPKLPDLPQPSPMKNSAAPSTVPSVPPLPMPNTANRF